MVCDMVEKPVRIAQLVAMWMREGWTDRCIFNLKLPMKKRHEEVERCRAIIRESLEVNGRPFELRIKQLYHDREEVSGFCRFIPRAERS
jgi:23S rRNA (cytidine2498-2'-O)-methyltransferase